MPVTKATRECYEVRKDGEWANIMLDCWERRPNFGAPQERVYYCGELVVHSSFGTWGYTWTACASPFKQFLQGVEFAYLFGKFMGVNLDRYDGAATLARLQSDTLAHRRARELTRAQAREAWSEILAESERIKSDAMSCGYALMDVAERLGREHPMREELADPHSWSLQTAHDLQAVTFWRGLWPLFIAALKAET